MVNQLFFIKIAISFILKAFAHAIMHIEMHYYLTAVSS